MHQNDVSPTADGSSAVAYQWCSHLIYASEVVTSGDCSHTEQWV